MDRIFDYLHTIDIDYYVAMTLFHYLIYRLRGPIWKAAKGGNGVMQMGELITLLCAWLLVLYSFVVMFLDTAADPVAFATIGLGAGIGAGVSALKNNNKPSPTSEGEGELIG